MEETTFEETANAGNAGVGAEAILFQVVWVQALAGNIVLCSWAKHFTLTVPQYPLRCINRYWQNQCLGVTL